MISALGEVQQQPPARPGANGTAYAGPTTKELPYDFVARFPLTGRRGNRVQDVLNISTDGAFVAVSIGYSVDLSRLDQTTFSAWQNHPTVTALRTALTGIPFTGTPLVALFSAAGGTGLPPEEMIFDFRCLLTRLCGLQFRYSIIDSGSGRELQNLPIPNLAGLGNDDGDRPFRMLPKPVLFMPRSTIRIEVEEVSEGLLYQRAELTIVMHGYKILGHGT